MTTFGPVSQFWSVRAGGDSGRYAECVRRDGEGGIEGSRGRKETAVHDVEVVDIVAAAVRVEDAADGVDAGDRGAAHVGVGRDAHAFGEHDRIAGLADGAADPLDQFLMGARLFGVQSIMILSPSTATRLSGRGRSSVVR